MPWIAAVVAFGAAAAWAAVAPPPAPPPAAPADLAAIDAAFLCPEALPDDAAREQALGRFMAAASAASPGEGVAQVLRYRRILLAKHGCARTLAGLRAAEDRVDAGAVTEQAWLPLGRSPGSGLTLSLSTTVLRPYADPRVPAARAVEAYARVDYAAPQRTDATGVVYDGLISHEVFYCAAGRYALLENDYLEDSAVVRRDRRDPPEPVAIPPGSLNDKVAQEACGAVPGAPA